MSTKVNAMPIVKLETPGFEDRGPVLIAGLAGRSTAGTLDDIPDLWAQFSDHVGKIPGQVGRVTYGACSEMFGGTGSSHYLSGVEVSESSVLPKQFSCLQIPAQGYVIFPHREHGSRLRYMVQAIWSQWFPESGYKAATNDGANLLERYGDNFNPQLGLGDIEVWIPCLVTVTNTSLAKTAQRKLQGVINQ